MIRQVIRAWKAGDECKGVWVWGRFDGLGRETTTVKERLHVEGGDGGKGLCL